MGKPITDEALADLLRKIADMTPRMGKAVDVDGEEILIGRTDYVLIERGLAIDLYDEVARLRQLVAAYDGGGLIPGGG